MNDERLTELLDDLANLIEEIQQERARLRNEEMEKTFDKGVAECKEAWILACEKYKNNPDFLSEIQSILMMNSFWRQAIEESEKII